MHVNWLSNRKLMSFWNLKDSNILGIDRRLVVLISLLRIFLVFLGKSCLSRSSVGRTSCGGQYILLDIWNVHFDFGFNVSKRTY